MLPSKDELSGTCEQTPGSQAALSPVDNSAASRAGKAQGEEQPLPPSASSPALKSDIPRLDPSQWEQPDTGSPGAKSGPLQGAVEEKGALEAGAAQGSGRAEMPKLDCLNFAARFRSAMFSANMATEIGELGISWIQSDYPVICGVKAGGGAQRAGVQAGDTLVAVNGRSARGLDPGSVNSLVTGIRGQQVWVSLIRSGVPFNVYATMTGLNDLTDPLQRANTLYWLKIWRRQ